MDANKMNTTSLAYLGDAVYEVYVRKYVLGKNYVDVNTQNKMAVRFVRAEGPAHAIKALFDTLPEVEQSVVRRGRNRKISSKPQIADPLIFKWETACEALFGYLYLTDTNRV